MGESMQASGKDGLKGAPDGVAEDNPSNRNDAGESGGGAYPNPHTGKEGKGGPSHGGQTDITYHGGGQPDGSGGPNAATSGD